MKVDKKATAVVQLNKFVVWSISAKVLPPDSNAVSKHEVDFEHLINQDSEHIHQIFMSIKYVTEPDAQQKCEVSVSASAIFEFNKDVDKEIMEVMVPQNCIPMTYSSIRGVVLSTTATLACGAVHLPSINFLELYKKKAKDFQKKNKST